MYEILVILREQYVVKINFYLIVFIIFFIFYRIKEL